MSENKSKMPDLKELAAMSSKLFTDIKDSVSQIIQDYKDIRAKSGVDDAPEEETTPVKKTTKKTKSNED